MAAAGGTIWETSAWACRLLFSSQQLRVCPCDGSRAFVEDRLAKKPVKSAAFKVFLEVVCV